MEKLRILFLITDLGKGGAERFLIDLCTELEKNENIEFIIGSLFDNNQYEEHTKSFTVVNLDFQTFSLRKKNENKKYKQLLESFKPHIIHTNRFLAEFISSYYVDKNIKYVCHGHDNMIQFKKMKLQNVLSKESILYNLEKRHLTKNKYNKVDTHFIANSTHTLTYYQENLPNNIQHLVRIIQYGFNFDRFYNPVKKKINPSSKLKILNVGSFQPKKNQVFLVEIAKELKSKGVDFEMNLCGQGELVNEVKKQINDNNLEGFVFLRGVIDNVQDWYNESDIYLHSAYYEPFGLVFLEAMASGLPVITLDGKGNQDIILDGKNGFIFYEQNAVKFADKIIELTNSPGLYQQISDYSKEFSKQFHVSKKTQELVEFYKSIVPQFS